MKKEIKAFGELKLSRKLLNAIRDMGFEEPSPIQEQTIPLVLEGCDVIGQAQTGTGKTAAFGIPTIEKINEGGRTIQALVLTPTRELAIQVAEELNKIGHYKHLRALPVYGGQAIERQIRALRSGVQIIVGTPGRLLDHLGRGTIDLSDVETLIFDEADEMLDMGFIDDIRAICEALPSFGRQTLLFSATMPEEILRLADCYMIKPKHVVISGEQLTVPLIDQFYYETRDKLDALCRILDVEETGKLIIFSRTKQGVDELASALTARGYQAGGLHGDLSQLQRDRVMKKFREGRLDILIATDVAARGLDIDDITHVVNYDIPQDHESYVHRIGRTGRAGRKGVAMTFIQPREFRQLRYIERMTKTKIKRRELPSLGDVLEHQREIVKEKVRNVLAKRRYEDYHTIITDLAEEGYEFVDIAAASLLLALEGPREEQENETNRFGNTGAASGMVRMFLNIGRNQHLRPEELVRTISENADISGSSIGVINIYDRFTFVEIREEDAEKVLSVMHHSQLRGYRVNMEPAKPGNR